MRAEKSASITIQRIFRGWRVRKAVYSWYRDYWIECQVRGIACLIKTMLSTSLLMGHWAGGGGDEGRERLHLEATRAEGIESTDSYRNSREEHSKFFLCYHQELLMILRLSHRVVKLLITAIIDSAEGIDSSWCYRYSH